MNTRSLEHIRVLTYNHYDYLLCFLQPSKVAPISELGFDAYLELPSAKELIEAFKTRKGAVKALLLDQVLHSRNIFWNSIWLFYGVNGHFSFVNVG